MNQKYRKIYSLQLASFLHENGILPIATEANKKNPKWRVWIYSNTPALEILLDIYMSKVKTEN